MAATKVNAAAHHDLARAADTPPQGALVTLHKL